MVRFFMARPLYMWPSAVPSGADLDAVGLAERLADATNHPALAAPG